MNSIIRAFFRLYHYLFSNTLHGTHSPFVYTFLENVVYQESAHKDKAIGLLYRIAKTRPNEELWMIKPTEPVLAALSELKNPIQKETTAFGDKMLPIVYFGEQMHPAEMLDTYHLLKNRTDSNSVFIFSKIRETQTRKKVWKHICKDSKNIISIDLFDTGILFFDVKKPKEHFKIFYR